MEETMHSRKLAIRVANRHLEAGVSEWVKWIVQPFEVLLRRSSEFVNGPIDDAMDNVFRDLAPAIVATIGEREVDADVEEFVEGAAHGRHDSLGGFFADDDPRWTNDYQNGYTWGFENAQTWKGGALPSSVRSQVVRDNVKEFRGELTEQLVKEALGKAWHTVDPRETVKHMLAAVKKHGWKVGIGFALFEILEHTVLPAALIALTGRPEMAITGTLPIGEILLPLILRSLGNVPGAINEANTAGHLDWYLENFGSIRLGHTNGKGRAALQRTAGKVSVQNLHGSLSVEDIEGNSPFGKVGQVAYLNDRKSGVRPTREALAFARSNKQMLDAMTTGGAAISALNSHVYKVTGKHLSWDYIQLPQ